MKSNSSATSTPAVAVPITAIGHCTVLEIGDSLGSDLGWGLARVLATTHALKLVQKDKSASGLVASWFYDWPRQLKAMLAKQHPDLVIVCIGGDDQQGIDVGGHPFAFNTPQWRARYTTLIKEVDTTATRAGSYVLWVGLPVMAPAAYRAGAVTLNSLYRSVAATVPGVTYLPSWNLFANAHGQYRDSASVNHVTSVLRAPDGIHMSVVGENVFATFVANQIAAIYHVIVKPSAPAYITG